MNCKLEAALRAARLGFRVVPIKANTKDRSLLSHPLADASRDEAQIAEWWQQHPDANIGVYCPDHIVIDIDVKPDKNGNPAQGKESFSKLGISKVQQRQAALVRTPSGGWHMYFRAPENVEICSKNGFRPGIDVRAKGGQGWLMAPGSTIDDKGYEILRWPAELAFAPQKFVNLLLAGQAPKRERRGHAIATGAVPDSSEAVSSAARTILDWPPSIEGNGGHDNLVKLAMRCGDIGISADRCLELLLALWNDRCNGPWEPDALSTQVHSAYGSRTSPLGCDQPAAQFSGVELPEPLVGQNSALAPIPIARPLLPVPQFDPAWLPMRLRAWCEDIASRLSVPLDFVAIPALVQAGALIGRAVSIRPERNTPWAEPANLWGCIVAPPGALKSPAIAEVLAPIKRLESVAQDDNKKSLADWEAKTAIAKIQDDVRASTAKRMLKDAKGDEDSALALMAPGDKPTKPPQKRLIVNDATVEKLGEICADNPNGVIYYRDEIMSFFSDLEKPDQASARGFILTAWSGKDAYTFDRIGRGTVHIPSVVISLLGTTQPDRIKRFIADSLRSMNDGMVQRLQMLVWPDPPGPWRSQDRVPDRLAQEDALSCYNSLASVDALALGCELGESGSQFFLRFANDASQRFDVWRSELERSIRDPEMLPELAAHLAKFRGLIPRLALVHHLASGSGGPVSFGAIDSALALGRYFECHARRAYEAGANSTADAANAVLRRIRKGDLRDGFTARDVKRHDWQGLTTSESVDGALQLLVDHRWLTEQRRDTQGRPSVVYRLNPLGFADK
ncbi:DUF3987 domain-containing protein [Novosphingobium sp. Fuku2-ISO-50]|uniref:DUF3987 domain-containing protein n=1 Tax=Novosphingobium sp. Fuku2-ISO-50 TaxID=1739114 RepID=UPI00076BD544|nr:DUF3987 domain-containing protein [Novosphingobium sp. Fuku2-ISO-50]KUR78809.1 hypothetical protein AQZ50_06595 [Novosphingobium sp. Fuku2-ISO-50]